MGDQATPVRVQLSRRKGWRMPPNTVKVDRTTKWGNPFIVGEQGTRAQCVGFYKVLVVQGYLAISQDRACVDRQEATLRQVVGHLGELRGKHLACWCPLTGPCHADVLLALANGQPVRGLAVLTPITDRIEYARPRLNP
jgi:hypothetical protein